MFIGVMVEFKVKGWGQQSPIVFCLKTQQLHIMPSALSLLKLTLKNGRAPQDVRKLALERASAYITQFGNSKVSFTNWSLMSV